MTSTRPDIAFVVEKLSRYASNPSKFHCHAIRQVLKYLKKTQDYGISYSCYPSVIERYLDASWITNKEDYTSKLGWVYLLGGGVVSWASKKQTCITDSTMAAEFVAVASKEEECLRNLLLEVPLWPKPISPLSMHCDSKSTLSKVYSHVYNGKSRHIGLRHAYVHQLIIDGVVTVDFVQSNENLADPLTKGLARDLVLKTSRGMGLKPISLITSNETST